MVAALRYEGANVFATDTADALSKLTKKNDPGTCWQALDIRDADAVAKSVAQAEETFGPVSLEVRSAALLSTDQIFDLPPDEWERVMVGQRNRHHQRIATPRPRNE